MILEIAGGHTNDYICLRRDFETFMSLVTIRVPVWYVNLTQSTFSHADYSFVPAYSTISTSDEV